MATKWCCFFEITPGDFILTVPVCLLEKIFLVIIFIPAEHRVQHFPLTFHSNIIDVGYARYTWIFLFGKDVLAYHGTRTGFIELVEGCLYLDYL